MAVASAPATRSALVVRVADHLLALPVEHVVEIMRPLPLDRASADGAALLGTARIRGAPREVIELGKLFDLIPMPSHGAAEDALTQPARYVVVRARGASLALRVDAVLHLIAKDQGEPVSKFAMRSISPRQMPSNPSSAHILELLGDVLADAAWLSPAAHLDDQPSEV